MPGLDLSGKVAIVTGAGNGLGRAYALQLASQGAAILVNDPAKDELGSSAADAVVSEITAMGGKAAANMNFVTKDLDDAEAIVKAAIDAFGRIDIIVNNAGILRDVAFRKQSKEQWSLVQEVHLYGQRNMIKAAWDKMFDQGFGRIVNITSLNAIRGAFGQTNYSAAKAGVIGLSKALALEGAKKNVKVNVVLPGAGTAMTGTIMPKQLVDAAKPHFVAPLIGYLCSDLEDLPTGRIFEAGAGFFAELQWRRSDGIFMDISKPITVQDVEKNWGKITDMKNCTDPIEDDSGVIPKQFKQAMVQARSKM
eukprot:TRINITY_DN76982_c0_g1_i1.p1 TRINITY_DN76982_c0_g1~~TRINITY_DN76982_c0_g1_i1.p1  ORF type:complete len:308 (+),score=62.37 TRINITY_DN76982_c0_g1_i1:80-1003(+)